MRSAEITKDLNTRLARGDKTLKETQSIAEQRAIMRERAKALVLDPSFTFEEVDVDGVRAIWVTPPEVTTDIVYLFFHGGAYVKNCVEVNHGMVAGLGKVLGARALSVDYRVAPEHPYPAGLTDAQTVYRHLLKSGVPANRIVVGGSSAGGGLSLALMIACRDAGDPQPGVLLPISPWADLTQSGKSVTTRADRDPNLTKRYLDRFAADYCGDNDPKTPGISPVFADFTGLTSAILAQVGSEEILLDDAVRVVEKAKAAGMTAKLEVYDGGYHGWQNAGEALPEAVAAARNAAQFINEQLNGATT